LGAFAHQNRNSPCPGAFPSYGYLNADYERNRSELDHRYANPEWMKDNVGWVIGAIAIALIIGSIYYVRADHPRTASIPDDATTGQSPPMSPTPPVRFSPGSMRSPAPKPAVGITPVRRNRHARSRVTNGSDVLPGVNGRTMVARRFYGVVQSLIADQAGLDRCSEAKLQLIRRFAASAVMAEALEAKLARGEQIDITQHAVLSSTLVRLAQRIGIELAT
jgi:hypothetical protein